MSKYGTEEIYGYYWDWSAMPFLRMLIALVIGIGLYHIIDIRSWWVPSVLIILIPVYQYMYWRRLSFRWSVLYGILMQVMVVILGYTVASIHDSPKDTNHYSHYLNTNPIDAYGVVTDIKERKNRYEATVCVHQLYRDSLIPVSGKLILYAPYVDLTDTLAIGQHISFNAQLIKHPEPRNPDVFDYGNFLERKGIHYQTKGATNINVISLCPSPRFWMVRHRASILQQLHEHIQNPTNYAIAASIILGYRDDINYETKRAFSETGSIHILAVSGMHVGIIFAVAGLFINRINNRRKWYKYLRAILFLIVLWGFVLLAGAPPSASRAALLFTLIIVSDFNQGSHDLFHRLASAAFGMLLINPNYLWDVGFQLSFSAVLGIAAFQPLRNKIREFEQRSPLQYIWDGLGITLGATLGTIPLTIFYFNYFPISGILSSVIVVFFAGIILYAGMAFLAAFWLSLLFPCWTMVMAGLGVLLNYIIEGLVRTVHFFHHLPLGLIEGLFLSLFGVICCYIILISVRMILNGSRKKVFIYASVLSILGLSLNAFRIKYANTSNQQIVFYHDYKSNAIEVVNGVSSVLISDDVVLPSQSVFMNKKFRLLRQIDQSINILYTNEYQDQTMVYTNGALRFGDQSVLILKTMKDLHHLSEIHWDYIVLEDNVDYRIRDLVDQLTFDEIIIAASNWRSRSADWSKACTEMNIPYRDINESNAIVIQVNDKEV